MHKVALLNMPCASARLPSIALTQLKSVAESHLGERVEVRVLYPNLDVLRYLGPEMYELLSHSVEANTAGLGDWFFRQAAWPELEDNAEAYLARHFSADRKRLKMLRHFVAKKRPGLGALLDSLIERYGLLDCSLVGFTSMFSQTAASLAMARRLKETKSEIVTVMGGANCESPMGQVLAQNAAPIDFVFSGPSLATFPQLLEHLVAGEAEKCHEIRGVLSRRKLAAADAVNVAEIGQELDIDVDVDVDYVDYFTALEERRLTGVKPKVLFETSRGCWWGERSHCTFCGLNGFNMKYRAMRPEKAVAQFEKLFGKYGGQVREFESVDNILPREYFKEVLPKLAPPDDAIIFYEIKADIKAHEARALAAAGIRRLQPGIEALNTRTLRLMKKGTTSFQNLKFLKYCLAYGIDPVWNLLIGFPGEEEEIYAKYYEDLPLLTHLPPPTGVYPVRFDRFSPYHTRADEYGLKLIPSAFYTMVYPFPEEAFDDMAYYFADENLEAPYIANTARWLGKLRERVGHWHERYGQGDRGLLPELRFEGYGDERTVYDSRSGEVVKHELDARTLHLLDVLDTQAKPAHLMKKLHGEIPEAEMASRLGELEERRLIFREGDLVMSLLTLANDDEQALSPREDSREGETVYFQRGAGAERSHPRGASV